MPHSTGQQKSQDKLLSAGGAGKSDYTSWLSGCSGYGFTLGFQAGCLMSTYLMLSSGGIQFKLGENPILK